MNDQENGQPKGVTFVEKDDIYKKNAHVGKCSKTGYGMMKYPNTRQKCQEWRILRRYANTLRKRKAWKIPHDHCI